MLPDERRARFEALAIEHDASHAELSRILERGDGYVSSYLRRAVPYDLATADRSKLARFFGVDPETLKPVRHPNPLSTRRRQAPHSPGSGSGSKSSW